MEFNSSCPLLNISWILGASDYAQYKAPMPMLSPLGFLGYGHHDEISL